MKRRAVVISINEKKNTAIVSPLITGHCVSCKENCAYRGSSFEARIATNLKIEHGSVVTIGTSKKNEAIQSIVSLLVPVLCAIFAYIVSPKISRIIFARDATEGFKATFVLLAMFVSCAFIYCASRFLIRPVKPVIQEVTA